MFRVFAESRLRSRELPTTVAQKYILLVALLLPRCCQIKRKYGDGIDSANFARHSRFQRNKYTFRKDKKKRIYVPFEASRDSHKNILCFTTLFPVSSWNIVTRWCKSLKVKYVEFTRRSHYRHHVTMEFSHTRLRVTFPTSKLKIAPLPSQTFFLGQNKTRNC